MASSFNTFGMRAQAFLVNIASHGIAFESRLSMMLPYTYPPYLRFFTNPQIHPFGGIQLLEAAYLLLILIVIVGLPLSTYCDPILRRRITWIGIGQRTVAILSGHWGMVVLSRWMNFAHERSVET